MQNARRKKLIVAYKSWILPAMNGCSPNQNSPGKELHMKLYYAPGACCCGKCGHEDWADATYPRVAYLPIDAIEGDDSYI